LRLARRLLVSFLTVALTASIGLAPAARAQDTCTLLTVAEVEAAFGVTDVEVDATASLCRFSGGTSLLVATQPGGELEDEREKDPSGVDATIGGNPALVSERARSIIAAVSGRLVGVTYTGDAPWDAAVPILTGLLELAIPRVAGPGAEDIARLEALLPGRIGGLPLTVQSYGGAIVLGSLDRTAPAVIAFMEALAAQGKTADDVLFVTAESTRDYDDYGARVVLIEGADAAVLLEPLFQALASGGEPLSFTAGEVGGKPVTLVTTDENVLTLHAFGDVMFGAIAPGAQLETMIANLPGGPSAAPSPSPEVDPGPAASPLPVGAVAPGTYTGDAYGVPVTFTVSDAWDEARQIPDAGFWMRREPTTIMVTGFAGEVPADPCANLPEIDTRDATARSLIDSRAENPALVPAGEPPAVEVGGLSGWRLDVTVDVPAACDIRQAAWLWVEPGRSFFRAPDRLPARFIALDTEELVIVVSMMAWSPADWMATRATADALFDSMVFDAEPSRPRSAASPVPSGPSAGPSPSASAPQPSAAASPSPGRQRSNPIPFGPIPPGTYTSDVVGIPVTLTVSDTWEGVTLDWGRFSMRRGPISFVVSAFAGEVAAHPCDHLAGTVTRDATARSLIDFLFEHPALAPAGEPTAVEVGGRSGWRLDATVDVPEACQVSTLADLWVQSYLETPLKVQDGASERFIVLDADGVVIVVSMHVSQGADWGASMTTTEALLDSMVIDANPARPRSAASAVPAGASPVPEASAATGRGMVRRGP